MSKRRLSPRKTPQQERSRATVEALLEATTDILIRQGYTNLTTNRIAERAGVNIASLYQYFPGKEAIVAELRRRHGVEQRAALRQVLAEHTAGELESTIRKLVSVGVAGHAQAPGLHRVFTEEIPALGYRDVAAIDAPIFEAMRRFLHDADIDVRELDLTLWIIATASGAVLHRAAVERPQDLSTGLIAEELTTLLCRYLRRRRRARRRARRGRCWSFSGGFMAKVTGIGGVFFKSTGDHKKLAEWYSRNLGIQPEPWGGALLRWTEDKSKERGVTVWHVAEKTTEWFSPSPASFMINYRIDNMSEMLAQLQRNGVDILKGPESDENGTFAWILDPDGNKVELWEPMPLDEKNTAT